MKVGFFLTGALQATYEDLLHQVRLGEEAGFDAVWLRDRHFHQDFARHPFPSPLGRGGRGEGCNSIFSCNAPGR